MGDECLSASFIADYVGISTGKVHSVLAENLLTRKVSERWVLPIFFHVQKAEQIDTLMHLLCQNNNI